jgi:hypothetical protein
VVLGGFPVAIAVWPVLENLNRLLPGTMGVALGRNPNGAIHDIADGYRILLAAPIALAGLLATLGGAAVLALAGTITGWALVVVGAVGLVAWPLVAERLAGERDEANAPPPLERAGFGAPFDPERLREVEAALGIEGADGPGVVAVTGGAR